MRTGQVLDLDSFYNLGTRSRLDAKGYKRSYLREVDGSRVKQEWWIALCLVPSVGQTPRGPNLRASIPEDGLGLGRN